MKKLTATNGFMWAIKMVSAIYTGIATWHVYNGDPLAVVLVEGAYLAFWVWVDHRDGQQSQDRIFDALGLSGMFAAVLAIGWADTGWLALWPRLALSLLVGRSVLGAFNDYRTWRRGRWSADLQRKEAQAKRGTEADIARGGREVMKQKAEALKTAQTMAIEKLQPELEGLVTEHLRREWLGVEEGQDLSGANGKVPAWLREGAQLPLLEVPKGGDISAMAAAAVDSGSSTGR